MSTDEYVPDEMDARGCFLDGAAGAFTAEDWEAFLARVRRDAAREALDGLVGEFGPVVDRTRIADYRDARYPEETP